MDIKTPVSGIYRSREGYLINKDNEALKAYKKKKEQRNMMKELEKDVIAMKDDIAEIKNLLRSLVK